MSNDWINVPVSGAEFTNGRVIIGGVQSISEYEVRIRSNRSTTTLDSGWVMGTVNTLASDTQRRITATGHFRVTSAGDTRIRLIVSDTWRRIIDTGHFRVTSTDDTRIRQI